MSAKAGAPTSVEGKQRTQNGEQLRIIVTVLGGTRCAWEHQDDELYITVLGYRHGLKLRPCESRLQ